LRQMAGIYCAPFVSKVLS